MMSHDVNFSRYCVFNKTVYSLNYLIISSLECSNLHAVVLSCFLGQVKLFYVFQVLAVSDIVVYRTRAERLHNDMFVFLSSASGAYLKHFTPELRDLSSRCGLDVPLSSLGPAIIVFQETTHTQLLGHGRTWKYIFMAFSFLVLRFCPTKISFPVLPCRF